MYKSCVLCTNPVYIVYKSCVMCTNPVYCVQILCDVYKSCVYCVQIVCDVYKVELSVFTGQSMMRAVVEKMKHVTMTRDLFCV